MPLKARPYDFGRGCRTRTEGGAPSRIAPIRWGAMPEHRRSQSGGRNPLKEAQRHLQNWSENTQAEKNGL